jgi:hypothetical protein
MPASTALANAWLQNLLNGVAMPVNFTGTNAYVSLHTADPGDAGTQATSEISYTGYARIAIVRNTTGGWTVSGKGAVNTNAALFGTMTGGTGGTVTYLAVGELLTGTGAIFARGAISPTIAVTTGVAPNFPATTGIVWAIT